VAGCRQTACESAAVQMSSPSSQTNRQPDRRTDRLCDASFTGGSGCQAGIASVGAIPQHSPPFQPQIWRQAAVQKRQGECGTRSGAGPAPTWPSPSFWSVPLHFPPLPPPPHTPASTSFTFITCLSLPRVFTLLHSNLCHSIKHMFLCALPSIA